MCDTRSRIREQSIHCEEEKIVQCAEGNRVYIHIVGGENSVVCGGEQRGTEYKRGDFQNGCPTCPTCRKPD